MYDALQISIDNDVAEMIHCNLINPLTQ